MLIPGISGGGTPRGADYLEVSSWSWGEHGNIGSQSSGSGAGKITFNPFSITREIDKASPILWQASATGKRFATVTFYMDPPASSVGAPGGDRMKLTLINAVISAISISSGGDNPSESVSFNYTKITMEYTAQGSNSSVTFGWDLATNKTI